MTVYLSRGEHDPEYSIRFPTTPDSVRTAIAELDEHCASSEPVRIVGTPSPATALCQYISCANVEEEADILKLNMLAGLVDGMSTQEQHILWGALDAESIDGLDDVLRVTSSLEQYQLVEGVTSYKQLGGWLVEYGLAGVDFPEEVRPYLNYEGIGLEYGDSHGGAFTPYGYVKRREGVQTQKAEDCPSFALTLVSPTGTYRLDLPASDAEFEQARGALGLDSLDSAVIGDVEIGYPWAHLLDMDSITLQDAHILAKCVREMTNQELKVLGALLEVEEPNSFSDANFTAMYLDNYELVEDSEREYGREALRRAGADDEVLEMLDGFTDFDALGRAEMEADGVRETSFGPVRRLSAPWSRQEPDMGPVMEGFA